MLMEVYGSQTRKSFSLVLWGFDIVRLSNVWLHVLD